MKVLVDIDDKDLKVIGKQAKESGRSRKKQLELIIKTWMWHVKETK